jgi:tetratricopeptide (TPR) repeat protein
MKSNINPKRFLSMEAEKRVSAGGALPETIRTEPPLANFQGPQRPSPLISFAKKKESASSSGGSAAPRANWTTRFLEGVTTFSLVALFFGLPLFFTGTTLQGLAFDKQVYFYLWILLGTVAWVAKGVVLGEMKIRRTPLDIPVLLFLGAYLASAFLSVDRWHSFFGGFVDPSRGLLGVAALVLAYYLIFSHGNARRFAWMAGAFVFSGWLLTVWSFLVVMGVRILPQKWAAYIPLSLTGTLGSLALVVGIMLPLFVTALSQLHSSRTFGTLVRRTGTVLLSLGVLVGLALLFVLHAYVSWWALLVGFGFFVIYAVAQIVRISEKWAWLPMFILVALLAFFMIGNLNAARVSLPAEVTPNLPLSWEVAKGALGDRFFFGSGPATYGYDFSLYRPEEYNRQALYAFRFYQGSGLFFEALPTLGVVGTLLFIVLALSFLSVGLYLLSQGREHNKVHSLGLWSASITLLVASVAFPINGTLLLLGVLLSSLSLAVLMLESGSDERNLSFSLKSSPKFALALAFIFIVVSAGVAFMFAFIGKVFLADYQAARAMRQAAAGEGAAAAESMSKAVRYMPKEGRYQSGLGQIYMGMARLEAGKGRDERSLDALGGYVRAAGAFVASGRDVSPNDIVAQEIMAQTYESIVSLAGLDREWLERTQKAYERALELEPTNPVFHVKLGQVKQAIAATVQQDERRVRLAEARDSFMKAAEKKPDLLEAQLMLALNAEAAGDLDAAVETLGKAFRISRDNADLKYNLARILRIRGTDDDLKSAEGLLKEVLATNDGLLNAHLNLGLLYEKAGRKEDAIKSYQKVLDQLSGEGLEEARRQAQTLIDNVRAGKSNLTEKNVPATEVNLPSDQVSSGQSASIAPETPSAGSGQ